MLFAMLRFDADSPVQYVAAITNWQHLQQHWYPKLVAVTQKQSEEAWMEV